MCMYVCMYVNVCVCVCNQYVCECVCVCVCVYVCRAVGTGRAGPAAAGPMFSAPTPQNNGATHTRLIHNPHMNWE